VLSGEAEGFATTVPLTVTEVRDDVFALSFRDQLHFGVVIEDLGTRLVHAFMVFPDLQVRRLSGKLTVL
jgi:hypothetical protein